MYGLQLRERKAIQSRYEDIQEYLGKYRWFDYRWICARRGAPHLRLKNVSQVEDVILVCNDVLLYFRVLMACLSG